MKVFPVDLAAKPKPSFADGYNGTTHKGIDIFADRGTQVLAVDDGTVRTAQEGKGGTVAYLTAGSRKYFYGHLDRFLGSSPRSVRAGEVIGFVGTTGNATNRPAHVHFQISEGGSVINPFGELAELAPRDVTRPQAKSKRPDLGTLFLLGLLVYVLTRRATT